MLREFKLNFDPNKINICTYKDVKQVNDFYYIKNRLFSISKKQLDTLLIRKDGIVYYTFKTEDEFKIEEFISLTKSYLNKSYTLYKHKADNYLSKLNALKNDATDFAVVKSEG